MSASQAGSVRFVRQGSVEGVADFCDENLNLLAHAQSIELDIGSRCGGHGVCGGDLVRVPGALRQELSDVTEEEKKHLSDLQISQGFRLACQCFPNRAIEDLTVEFSLGLQ